MHRQTFWTKIIFFKGYIFSTTDKKGFKISLSPCKVCYFFAQKYGLDPACCFSYISQATGTLMCMCNNIIPLILNLLPFFSCFNHHKNFPKNFVLFCFSYLTVTVVAMWRDVDLLIPQKLDMQYQCLASGLYVLLCSVSCMVEPGLIKQNEM